MEVGALMVPGDLWWFPESWGFHRRTVWWPLGDLVPQVYTQYTRWAVVRLVLCGAQWAGAVEGRYRRRG